MLLEFYALYPTVEKPTFQVIEVPGPSPANPVMYKATVVCPAVHRGQDDLAFEDLIFEVGEMSVRRWVSRRHSAGRACQISALLVCTKVVPQCMFVVLCWLNSTGRYCVQGQGKSKRAAEHDCADKAFAYIRSVPGLKLPSASLAATALPQAPPAAAPQQGAAMQVGWVAWGCHWWCAALSCKEA